MAPKRHENARSWIFLIMRIPKYLAIAFASALGFAVTLPAQQAWAISRSSMVSYAHLYSCNGSNSCRNSAWKDFGSTDCTNFVSQVMDAGGYGMVHTGVESNQWFYDIGLFGIPSYSTSWDSSSKLMAHLTYSNRVSTLILPTMTAKYSGASPGDIYFYDWGRGAGWSHAAVSTGTGTFANYFDTTFSKNYLSVTSGSGDRIAQHSTDRDDAPWNWGYWTETDMRVIPKMKTIVYHLN